MARGISSPATSSLLPVAIFIEVEKDGSAQPAGVHDQQARSYGYNDFSEFRRPDHYIRHIEPLESELAIQVEYDMDEQDQEWLDTVNAERKKEQLNTVSYETFEIIMDRLEKEWFDLTKNLPKPDLALPSEDSTCAICDDSEGENSNAIVFCDGCNLAVHQDCYGVPYIPEGQWLCRKCTVSPENPVTCILCPNEGGAFKQTVHGEWVHLLCAIWVPETRVANEVFMEPITGVDKISKQRWKLKCSLCDIRQGACIQCARTSCFLAFHATCARREKLLMPMKGTQGAEPTQLTSYCEKHLPKEQQEIRAAALAAEDSGEGEGNRKLSKSARAYAKTYKPGPPLVPFIIVDRIMQYIGKVSVRKKMDFVLMMCKYWSLKREARRGAPLLKRLHLEPWTSSTSVKHQTEEDKATKLEFMRGLRDDLEQVRRLVELSRKRESRKLMRVEIIRDVLSLFLFPHEPPMRLAFEKIMGLDRSDYFKNPVSKAAVPDYFDVVENPMCWSSIDAKLDRHEYWDLQMFKDDVMLVLDNAILYNKPGTNFHKAALRIKQSAPPILNELDRLSKTHNIPNSVIDGDQSASTADSPGFPTPGDLEPPLDTLELLASADHIKDDMDLILHDDPLTALFNFELADLKPKPPPSSPKTKSSSKRKRKSGPEGQRSIKDTTEQPTRDESSGFRVPRTRRAMAAAAEFEAEVSGKRLPGSSRSDVPPTVDDVDNQQSFKMFDAGWILPPDQKRGGRAAGDRPSYYPPHHSKQPRTDPGPSRLSVFSTPASENQTLNKAKGVRTELPGSSESWRSPIEGEHIQTIVTDGVTIIEELDSPSIRRKKNIRRKVEKLKLETRSKFLERLKQRKKAFAAEMAAAASSSSPSQVVLQEPAPETADQDSDLSSLSDSDGGGGDEAIGEASSMALEAEPKTAGFEPSDFPLEGGTLVWAKADTYPWWPAVIYEDDDPLIPKAVLKLGEQLHQRRTATPLSVVQFYDKSSSWQWLDHDRLKPLGEDSALDESLLSASSHHQRWKVPSVRNECRAAYRRAVAEMETGQSDHEMGVDHDAENVVKQEVEVADSQADLSEKERVDIA